MISATPEKAGLATEQARLAPAGKIDLSWVIFADYGDEHICEVRPACPNQAVYWMVIRRKCGCDHEKPGVCLKHKQFIQNRLNDGADVECSTCLTPVEFIRWERIR